MAFKTHRAPKKKPKNVDLNQGQSVSLSTNPSEKNNLTRKEQRKQARLQKKARRHAYFSNQPITDETKSLALPNQEAENDAVKTQCKETKDLEKMKQNKVKKIEKLQMKRRKMLMIEENKREEKNIHLLEKKLKINRRKSNSLPKFFINDGLDYLLEVCDREKFPNLREPELSDADSNFDEDFAVVTGQKQTNDQGNSEKCDRKLKKNKLESEITKTGKVGKKRKVTFSLPSPEVNFDDSQTDSSISDDDSEEVHDNQLISSNEVSEESADDDEQIAADQFSCEEEEEEKCSDLSSDEPLVSEVPKPRKKRKQQLHDIKTSETEGCNEMDGDDIETFDKQNHKVKTSSNYWEDIYGRLRDKDGNVIENTNVNLGHYVPPALRKLPSEGDAMKAQLLDRLKKQLKGLLNRLSESNVKSISNEIEELYMRHSRNDMNDTLINLVMTAIVQIALTPERMAQEHALLIALLHANVGSEVGALFIERIADKFNSYHNQGTNYGVGKECDNLLQLLVHLYTFKIVHATIIYDILQLLAESLLEKDVELILLILRSAGFTLRKDDPLRLKNVIIKLQNQASQISHSQDQLRVQFMMDTLMAIRNNNMNKIPNYDPSHTEHLKKLLRSLMRKGNSVVELKISLDDLLNVESRGRWWVVGSAWAGQASLNKPDENVAMSSIVEHVSDKILDLACKQRMNTDVRKNIFCIIMTAEDYIDAFEKLLRLGLSNQQEREIIHVAMECCLQEKNFNPFYAFLLQRFCSIDRKYQMAIQYAVWDKIKELSSVTSVQLSNLAHLIAKLLIEKSLAISVLKVIEFSEMDKTCVKFLRQILLKILLHDSDHDVETVFIKVARSPKLHMFREGLRLFMLHFMLKNKEKLPYDLHQKLQARIQAVENVLTSCEVTTKF